MAICLFFSCRSFCSLCIIFLCLFLVSFLHHRSLLAWQSSCLSDDDSLTMTDDNSEAVEVVALVLLSEESDHIHFHHQLFHILSFLFFFFCSCTDTTISVLFDLLLLLLFLFRSNPLLSYPLPLFFLFFVHYISQLQCYYCF